MCGVINGAEETCPSSTFCGGITAILPAARVEISIGNTPAQGRRAPSSASSPANRKSGSLRRASSESCSLAARIPTAIGKSNWVPLLRSSAGLKLTVMRLRGKSNPLLRRAAITRSLLSFTSVSGRPTTDKVGIPGAMSTSTETKKPSMPLIAQACTLESIYINSSTIPCGVTADTVKFWLYLRKILATSSSPEEMLAEISK